VELVRDPSTNGGVAVVRIQDTKGGREGYTFDLEWRGGSNAGGWDRDGDRGRRGGSYTLTCASDNMRRNYCQADVRGGVRLVRQQSQAPCRENYSWGYDRRGIWVDRGCRAEFEVGR
jgi:hypothetical protein